MRNATGLSDYRSMMVEVDVGVKILNKRYTHTKCQVWTSWNDDDPEEDFKERVKSLHINRNKNS